MARAALTTVGWDQPPERYIVLDSGVTDPLEARIAEAGVHVWALIGHLAANNGNVTQAAIDYDLPSEAVLAALAYYWPNRAAIDARLALHAAFFTPAA